MLRAIFRVLFGVSRSKRRDISSSRNEMEPIVRATDPIGLRYRRVFDTSEPNKTPTAQTLKGQCHVIDGDTIVISGTKIRLAGIDAPELNHPWGKNSKFALINLCKGKVVTAEIMQDVSYDRLVAKCLLPDGTDLAAALVEQGLALDWPRFSGGIYSHLEPPNIRKKLWRAAAKQQGRYKVEG